ncbi:MAG: lipopolysaccharide biosynthesis protein [Phyllobacteriaceae bacterium]|nr:lipopolysaccharide biosynthesis protein [Phyllobacteriaceae bacterium]
MSGSAGRLVFSLAYFVLLANTLSLGDFGLFAAASAAGVMLSRILAFGFTSPLYRIATVKPQLVGVYTAGALAFGVASLVPLTLAAALTHALVFNGDIDKATFTLLVAAEALLWRPTEIVAIVNNGMGRFGRAARLTILGTALRAAAALAFVASPWRDLSAWAWFYFSANAVAFAFAVFADYPRQRLRFVPKLYLRRLRDAAMASLSEMVFYMQAELDKLVVLALGGAEIAGAYAVIMRLVDLTAIPVRAFAMMLVQKIMRAPAILDGWRRRAGIEAGIFLVSSLGLAALAGVLWLFPNALGRNVAGAAGLIGFAVLIPGLRNLGEYHAELLYARGQTGLRVLLLAGIGLIKIGLLAALLAAALPIATLIGWMNAVFLALYLASALLTYAALRRPSRAL